MRRRAWAGIAATLALAGAAILAAAITRLRPPRSGRQRSAMPLHSGEGGAEPARVSRASYQRTSGDTASLSSQTGPFEHMTAAPGSEASLPCGARPSGTWLSLPHRWRLEGDEVHVLASRLDLPPAALSALVRLLSRDELERARRFLAERDRRRFIAAHGTLRALLGRCLRWPPSAIRFRLGRDGKPSIASPGVSGLHFNLSHAGERSLIAIAREREVGVDLEPIRADIEFHEIALRIFTATERAALARVSAAELPEAFFRCWVRKESRLKATGDGLSGDATEVEVTMAAEQPAAAAPMRAAFGGPAALLASPGTQASTRWLTADLNVGHGYVGAVTAAGPAFRLRRWTIPAVEGLAAPR